MNNKSCDLDTDFSCTIQYNTKHFYVSFCCKFSLNTPKLFCWRIKVSSKFLLHCLLKQTHFTVVLCDTFLSQLLDGASSLD